MIFGYNLSVTGRDHIKSGLPCHDYSKVFDISSSWKVAVVADGVGSCKFAAIASKTAVEAVTDLLKKQFPPHRVDDSVYTSIVCACMHGAANSIESYVEKYDPGNELEYQTTLALAIMSKHRLIWGNIGDSGIISLDDNGSYHVMNEAQNDENGGVFSMPLYRDFEIGVADFRPTAVLCSTDGIFNYLAPKELAYSEYRVYAPLANLFITYALNEPDEEKIDTEKQKERIISYLKSETCNVMTDDLSCAVLVTTESFLREEDIAWESPKIDPYRILWDKMQIYPSKQTKIHCFLESIKQQNPEWSNEQLEELASKYVEENLKANNDDEKFHSLFRKITRC